MRRTFGIAMQIGIAVITYRARALLEGSLPPLLKTGHPVLVVNSSSHDGTVEYAESLGAKTLIIPRNAYNHGLTRELARKKMGGDIALFTTPDAILIDPPSVEALVEPLQKKEAAAAFARQIPHLGADFYEAFPRSFNYPEKSYLSRANPFISNSFAAYRNDALDQIGGFQKTLSGEDAIAAAKLQKKGEKIAYVAECLVRHSHRYTLLEEFRRAFDTGYYREENRELFEREEQRGIQYAKEMMKKKPLFLPYTLLHLAARYGGFLLGRRHRLLPSKLMRVVSSQEFYWE